MRFAPVACALLLVLAGCGAAPAGPSPTTTATDAPTPAPTPTPTDAPTMTAEGVEVTIGDLPFDPDPVFERVLALTGEDVEPPDVHASGSAGPTNELTPPAFQRALGVDEPDEPLQLAGYVMPSDAGVRIYEHPDAANSTAAVESTLAHEFVHVVQVRNGWTEETRSQLPRIDGELTTDAGYTLGAISEGAATLYQDRYDREYLPSVRPALAGELDQYRNASAYNRLVIAPYALGGEYVEDRVAAGESLESIHHDPPTSTEQLLHRTGDPIAPLNVTTNPEVEWAVVGEDTQGELFLRIVLRTELNRSAAVDAAHGWGNDRRITYDFGSETGTAWVLRWDDTANATEFERHFREYLAAKATKEDGVWRQDDGDATYRLRRVSDETVAVFLGDESFVRAANATAPTGPANLSVNVGVGNASTG
jgi:hypothetical protein